MKYFIISAIVKREIENLCFIQNIYILYVFWFQNFLQKNIGRHTRVNVAIPVFQSTIIIRRSSLGNSQQYELNWIDESLQLLIPEEDFRWIFARKRLYASYLYNNKQPGINKTIIFTYDKLMRPSRSSSSLPSSEICILYQVYIFALQNASTAWNHSFIRDAKSRFSFHFLKLINYKCGKSCCWDYTIYRHTCSIYINLKNVKWINNCQYKQQNVTI